MCSSCPHPRAFPSHPRVPSRPSLSFAPCLSFTASTSPLLAFLQFYFPSSSPASPLHPLLVLALLASLRLLFPCTHLTTTRSHCFHCFRPGSLPRLAVCPSVSCPHPFPSHVFIFVIPLPSFPPHTCFYVATLSYGAAPATAFTTPSRAVAQPAPLPAPRTALP